MTSAYPRMLYRDGGPEEIWGRLMETCIVETEEQEGDALADGWRLSPVAEEGGDPAADVPVRRGPGRPRKVEVVDAFGDR